MRIVPRAGFSNVDERRIARLIRQEIFKRTGIFFEEVEQIPRLSNGKFCFVISKVGQRVDGTIR